VINVRKITTILGFLIIATILISGSAVATWRYATSQNNIECTNPDEALDDPDEVYATIGNNGPLPELGVINLSMGEHPIKWDTEFTIIGAPDFRGNINETYGVEVMTANFTVQTVIGNGYDAANCVFTTPSEPEWYWQYVVITGSSGETDSEDSIYGPEIDAVGWDKPP
jgi:hypothetical protein